MSRRRWPKQRATSLSQPSFVPVAARMDRALPFADGRFDAVICQLGLQFFPDPARGLAEFHRVLRPGRVAAVCVISTSRTGPRCGVFSARCSATFFPTNAKVLELSFALSDPTRLQVLFAGAGFRDISVQRETRPVAFDNSDDYWEPIEAGIGVAAPGVLSLPDAERRAAREGK